MHQNQVRFIPVMQRCFNIHKSINAKHQINLIKKKKMTSGNTQKAFYKIPHLFKIKKKKTTSQQIMHRRKIIQLSKGCILQTHT